MQTKAQATSDLEDVTLSSSLDEWRRQEMETARSRAPFDPLSGEGRLAQRPEWQRRGHGARWTNLGFEPGFELPAPTDVPLHPLLEAPHLPPWGWPHGGRDWRFMSVHVPALSGSTAVTVEACCWQRYPQEEAPLVSCPLFERWKPPFVLMRLGLTPEVRPEFELLLEGARETVRLQSASVTANAYPRHVAGTYDGDCLRLFVNGVQVAERPASGRLEASAQPVAIGVRSVTDPRGMFAGTVGRPRIWNRALTAEELVQSSERYLVLPGPPGLLMAWEGAPPIPQLVIPSSWLPQAPQG